MESQSITSHHRILGSLWGSLVGDALGVPVEFRSRAERAADPVTTMRSYGTHHQPEGTWSDDGALLLCAVESHAEKGFDTQDMGNRFVRWYEANLWTSHGTVFDIGNATRKALKLISNGCPAKAAGGTDVTSNGNGSLMRILPTALASLPLETAELKRRLHRASAITHGHVRSQMACVFHGLFVRAMMKGHDPIRALQIVRTEFPTLYQNEPEMVAFQDLLHADLQRMPERQIKSGGYVIDTLLASIWCLIHTKSYAECVLKAVNLGDDTDTTGCVAGGLAGLLYGIESIPAEWHQALPRQTDLNLLFERFLNQINDSQ